MNKIFQKSAAIKVAAFLAILAVLLLWAIQHTQAQSQPPEDNYPMPAVSSNPQTNLPDSPGDVNARLADPNLAGSLEVALPDLTIIDPNSDVIAEVEKASGVKASYSMVIPAADFTPDGNGRTWFFGFNSSYIYPTSASGYCGIAPVYLPDGATVTAFISYVYDNDPISVVSAYLYAKPLASTTSAPGMANADTSGGDAAILQTVIDLTIDQAVIDNAAFTYHIGVCMFGQTSDSRFYASQILYNK